MLRKTISDATEAEEHHADRVPGNLPDSFAQQSRADQQLAIGLVTPRAGRRGGNVAGMHQRAGTRSFSWRTGLLPDLRRLDVAQWAVPIPSGTGAGALDEAGSSPSAKAQSFAQRPSTSRSDQNPKRSSIRNAASIRSRLARADCIQGGLGSFSSSSNGTAKVLLDDLVDLLDRCPLDFLEMQRSSALELAELVRPRTEEESGRGRRMWASPDRPGYTKASR